MSSPEGPLSKMLAVCSPEHSSESHGVEDPAAECKNSNLVEYHINMVTSAEKR